MGEVILFWATIFGTVCWPICFWWMHRISNRQEELLRQLHEQTKRIEQISQAEHELIQEVHPNVGEIKENLKEVVEDVHSKKENGVHV
jgi:hypothetical protein